MELRDRLDIEFRNVSRRQQPARAATTCRRLTSVLVARTGMVRRAGAKRGRVRFLVPSVASSTAERIDPFSEIKCRGARAQQSSEIIIIKNSNKITLWGYLVKYILLLLL